MGNEVIGRRTVPVPLVRSREDDVAGTNSVDRVTAGLDESLSVGDVQRLTERVRMPGGARPGLNRTPLTGRRDGSSPLAIASIQTTPVNQSEGPLADGGLGRISTRGSSARRVSATQRTCGGRRLFTQLAIVSAASSARRRVNSSAGTPPASRWPWPAQRLIRSGSPTAWPCARSGEVRWWTSG